MKKIILSIFVLFAILTSSLGLLVGCDNQATPPRNFDLSNIKVLDTTFDYDGTAKTVAIVGDLPSELETKITYFEDENHSEEIYTLPVNSGIYYAKVDFVTKAKGTIVDSRNAKITINKIDFPENLYSFKAAKGTDLATPKQDSTGGLYFEFDGETYVPQVEWHLDSLSQGSANVEYYTDAALTKRVIVSIKDRVKLHLPGDEFYLKVTIADNNHTDKIEAVQKFYMTKRIVEIHNKTELLKLNTDIYENMAFGEIENKPNSNSLRQYFIYKLMDDIDLSDEIGDKGVWQTITPSYEPLAEMQPFFCSEFDGNGHTIKNFKINKDSVKYTLTLSDEQTVEVDGLYRKDPVQSFMETYAGFFGFVVGANIHDITFENVEFDLDFNDIKATAPEGLSYTNNGWNKASDRNHISQVLHAGVVVGRTVRQFPWGELNGASACSAFENIKVNNVSGKIVCAQMYFGGIIGTDNNVNIDQTFERSNLNVSNIDLICQYTGTKTGSGNYHVGGIVGQVLEASNTLFEKCSSSGQIVILGYDSAGKYSAVYQKNTLGSKSLEIKDSQGRGTGMTDYASQAQYGYYCMGGIVGRVYRVGCSSESFTEVVTLKDCSSSMKFVAYNYYKSSTGAGMCYQGYEHNPSPDTSRQTTGLCGYNDVPGAERLVEIDSQDDCSYDIHTGNNEKYSPAV